MLERKKSKLETACKEKERLVEIHAKEMVDFQKKQEEIQVEIRSYQRKVKEAKEELRERKKPIRKHESLLANLESDIRSSEGAKIQYRKQVCYQIQ